MLCLLQSHQAVLPRGTCGERSRGPKSPAEATGQLSANPACTVDSLLPFGRTR